MLEVITLTEVRLTISEGRYHQVKRMFAAVGNHVVGLHRERIGDILLDDALAPGEYRPLTETEIASVGARRHGVKRDSEAEFFSGNCVYPRPAGHADAAVDRYVSSGAAGDRRPVQRPGRQRADDAQHLYPGLCAGSAAVRADGRQPWSQAGDPRRDAGVRRGGGGLRPSQTIDMLIVMRFFHGLAAAAASVVINALMRDIYPKDEFSRMMSFVMLVTTIAPLVAPMVGGAVLVWFSWHAIFWILALVSPAGLADDRPVYPRNAAS